MTDPKDTRRWRLRGWDDAGTVIHDSRCTGDAALDVALRDLEHDARTRRTRVEPA